MTSSFFSVRSSSTQLWAVDDVGSTYVFQDVWAWLSSFRSNEVLHSRGGTCHPRHADNWTSCPLNCRLDHIVCGCSGLVVAKKDKKLYIRRGVSYDNPLGTSWTKTVCDAEDLVVGRHCIVRRTSKDQLFVADSLDLSSSGAVFLPHWSSIPQCELVETHQFLALDSRDNLFTISPSTGEVHVCPRLTLNAPEKFKWSKLSDGPPALKNQSIFGILGWGSKSSSSPVFSAVSSGDSCIWCLGGSGNVVHQLVLTYTAESATKSQKRRRKSKSSEEEEKETRKTDNFQITGMWKKFNLPKDEVTMKDDEVTMIFGDHTQLDTFYGVLKNSGEIVSYNVLQVNCGRVIIPNSVGMAREWKSLSLCSVPHPDAVKFEHNSEPGQAASSSGHKNEINNSIQSLENRSIPSIYPKLPFRENYDLCCEDGECYFCKSTSSSQGLGDTWTSTVSSGMDTQWNHGEEEGEGGGAGELVTGRRWKENVSKKPRYGGHDERGEGGEGGRGGGEGEGRRRGKRRRDNDDEGMRAVRSKKRPRVASIDQLSGVPFKLSSSLERLLPQTQHMVEHEVPIQLEDIDKKFVYKFTLEKQVMASQIPKNVSHFTSGYWTVNYPERKPKTEE